MSCIQHVTYGMLSYAPTIVCVVNWSGAPHDDLLRGSCVHPVVVAKFSDYQHITRVTRLVLNRTISLLCVCIQGVSEIMRHGVTLIITIKTRILD